MPDFFPRVMCSAPQDFECSDIDRINYFPGYNGRTEFDVCFHDLRNGLQTHVYAPLGLDIKDKWTIGGTLPHEPKEPVELGLGVPKDGLYLREDVDMKCNIMATSFVKKTLKKAHGTLVDRLVEKAHIRETELHNSRLEEQRSIVSQYSGPQSPGFGSPMPSPDPTQPAKFGLGPHQSSLPAYQNLEPRGSVAKPPYPYSPPMENVPQQFTDARYSQPPPDPRYSQPPTDPRYSLPQTHYQDPKSSYQSHRPVELASSTSGVAELDSSTTQRSSY
ncbi:MAG: hypothetical protein Q9220_002022 [cf. Caloplaca sp. 1 TL-2023]